MDYCNNQIIIIFSLCGEVNFSIILKVLAQLSGWMGRNADFQKNSPHLLMVFQW